MSDAEPTFDALKVKYQELHITFRTAVDLYLKGSALALAFLGVSLGFLLQARLGNELHVRLLIACDIIVGLLWYSCSFGALQFYKSIIANIRATTVGLGLHFNEGEYNMFKVIVRSGMLAAIPVSFVLFFLLISPP